MTTREATQVPTYSNPVFDKGVRYGIEWHRTGWEEFRVPTAQLIVEYIRDNILEPEWGQNTPEELLNHAGFLTGWIIGQFLTEEDNGRESRPV